MPATITPFDDFRLSPRAAKFQGGEDSRLSFFITHYARGDQADLHTHPYPETFIVHAGTATFTVGDEELTVPAGTVVVVPAETVHGYRNDADELLHVVGIHPSPEVIQTDL